MLAKYLEDTIVDYLNLAYEKYPINNLCLSGGVAANIIMSLNIYDRTNFKNIYVLPPMGDDGLAIGSAILTALEVGEDVSWLKDYVMPYFGDEYTREQVKQALDGFDNIIVEDLEKLGLKRLQSQLQEARYAHYFTARWNLALEH